jgi:hypothetical protein
MGNYISKVEGFESPGVKTAFRKFKKSKDFLRIYVEHDNELKKILSDKGTNNENHGVKTKVLKEISKKAKNVYILSKNISFHVAVAFTTNSDTEKIFTKTVKAKLDTAITNTNDDIITISNVKRVHAVYIYVPSHLKEMYSSFPQDKYALLDKNKNTIKLQSIVEKVKSNKKLKAQKQKEGSKMEQKPAEDVPKTERPETEKLTEGFNHLKRRVLWSADGTMKIMGV